MAEAGFNKPVLQNLEMADERTAATYLNDLGLNWEQLKGKKVLDLGAGLAGFAKAAKKRGVDVVSLDLHPEWWVKEGKQPKGTPFVIGNGKQLPFKDETFDMVVGRASVHSMVEIQEDLVAVIGEAKRVLKSGGEFRFGPGSISTRSVRESEWDKWFNLMKKVRNKEKITPEEDTWGAKVWPQYEQELIEDKALEGLSTKERIKKLQEFSLTRLQSIDPTIIMQPITRTLAWKGKQETFNDVYYVMKKESIEVNG